MLYRLVWTVQYRYDPDFTAYAAKIGVVVGLEVWLAIIIACIPTLGPLVRQPETKPQPSDYHCDRIPLNTWNARRPIGRYGQIGGLSTTELDSINRGTRSEVAGSYPTTTL